MINKIVSRAEFYALTGALLEMDCNKCPQRFKDMCYEGGFSCNLAAEYLEALFEQDEREEAVNV